MKTVTPLHHHVQRVLPTVYDDSLSFYELVTKVVQKVNELIEQSNEYFGQDLKSYVTEILQDWTNDGTLETIINETVFQGLNDEIQTIKKRLETRSVTEFGAVGDGLTDDTQALQTALNEGGLLLVPQGIYRVTETLQLPKTVVLIGEGYSIDIAVNNASVIWLDRDTEKMPLFRSSVPNHELHNLYFKGNNFTSDRRVWAKGFEFSKGTVFGDTDVTFKGCHFKRFSTSIQLQGRGLNVTDCTFEEQWNPIVLQHFNNDEVTNPPQYDWQTNIRGFRKFHFVNNLFHACQGHTVVVESTSSNNYEKHIHQVVYTGNRHDGTGGIWKGYVGGATFSGNTLGKSSSMVYGLEMPIFDLHGAKSVTVTGNTFSSELDLSRVKDREIYLGDIFLLASTGEYVDITVTGNTFTGVGKRLFHALGGVSRLHFSNNVVNGVLLEKPESHHRPFQFVGLGNSIVIKNNLIKNTRGNVHDHLVYFNNRGWLDCSIEGNVYEKSEFSLVHNLYAYNMNDTVQMTNYTGDGNASQVLSFDRQVLFVIIAEYGTPKTLMKRTGTSNGNQLVEIVDNQVTVKGIYNTTGTAYSIVVYTV